MHRLQLMTDRLVMTLALLGTLGIAAIVLHVTLDIVLRSTLSVSMPATLQMVTRYYMVLLALMPLGWVEWKHRMISVEIAADMIPARLQPWIDGFVTLFCLLIYLVFMWATWGKAVDQFNTGSYVMALDRRLPVWPTYFVLPLAFFLASLVCCVRSLFLLTGYPTQPQQSGAE